MRRSAAALRRSWAWCWRSFHGDPRPVATYQLEPSIGLPENRYTLRESERWSNPTVTEPLVYLNGQFLPASQAQLAIYDAGLVLGATVTEQTRTFHKQLFRLDAHLDRLFRALYLTRMDIGLSRAELIGIGDKLITHN